MGNYRYYLNNVEVFPLNKDDLQYNYEKQIESSVYLEKNLETPLVFNYQSGNFNFKTQEEDDRCSELNLIVEKICGNQKETFFEGAFSVSEGEFDDDKCLFTVKVRKLREIIEDIQVNILQTPELPSNVLLQYGIFTGVYCPNAITFPAVLLYVAKRSNHKINGVVSNFFQINPDGAFYITGVPIANYTSMYLMPLSDVQNPAPSNPATIATISFKELMDDLKALFNVEWFVDENYNLRVEHEVWFDDGQGLDLTSPQYSKYLLGKNKYSYDLSDYPRTESWTSQGHAQTCTLKYGGLSSLNKNKNSKSFSTTKIHTDLNSRMLTGEAEDGIFLFASNAVLPPVSLYYGPLSPPILVTNFFKHNRPDLYSIMEVSDSQNIIRNAAGGFILESVAPTKKQTEIIIPLCCDDEFDTKKQPLTNEGLGYVEKASFETKSNILKLELKYKVEGCYDFNPLDLNALDLWLVHEEGLTLSGSDVVQWDDQSGNNRHAVQATPANRPTYPGGGFTGGVDFNPVGNQFLTVPAFQLFPNKRGTVFILFSYAGAGPLISFPHGNMPVISTQDGGASNYFDITVNGLDNIMSISESVIYKNSGYYNSLIQNAGLFVFNRSEDTTIKMNHDGVDTDLNPVEVITNTQQDSLPLIIGSNTNLTPSGNTIRIKELLIFNRSLTDNEIEKVQFYLVKKTTFGVTPQNFL